jgi:dGTPase
MSMMWGAINSSTGEASPFERYVFNEISESYRRVYQSSTKDKYCKYQLLCDAVSGMTEGYLVKKHNEFRELLNASTST